VRHWRPNLADGLQRPANLISKFLNLVVAAYILATPFWTLARIRLVGFAGMLTLMISTVAIGWLMGCKGNAVPSTGAIQIVRFPCIPDPYASYFLLSILTICRLRLRLYYPSAFASGSKFGYSLAQVFETSTRICGGHWIGLYIRRLLGFTKVNDGRYQF